MNQISTNNMTTREKIKKVGWTEVEQLQEKLKQLNEDYFQLSQVDILSQEGNHLRQRINETRGKIEGMVFILNMLR